MLLCCLALQPRTVSTRMESRESICLHVFLLQQQLLMIVFALYLLFASVTSQGYTATAASLQILMGSALRRYSDSQDWKSAVVEWHAGEDGGYKEVVLEVQGDSVYSKLKYEAGAHASLDRDGHCRAGCFMYI